MGIFGSQALETAIGLVLMFLFMSIIASALSELVEQLLKTRARQLEKGILELLGGDQHLVAAFYEHLIIASLYKGAYTENGRQLPSYIPRESFSLAVLEIAKPRSRLVRGPLYRR